MNLVFSEDPTEQGDQVAAVMRAHYDEHRPLTFVERLFGKRSTVPLSSDDLMIGLANIAIVAADEWRKEFNA